LRSIVASLAFPLRQSLHVGVGHSLTASARLIAKFSPLARTIRPVAVISGADDRLSGMTFRGVGQRRQDPDPVSLVGRSDMVSSQHSPPRIIPHFGKVTEDHGKTSSHKQRAVFHEDVSRSYLTDNPCHLGPQAGPCPADSCALSGCADVLAGEPAGDDIDLASPGLAVEGADIVPDRESR
jgi:hypothetical protein